MCRCCQSCLEDFYWNCIEEKFCYDESIAYYNAEEDEHYQKKTRCSYLPETLENNNGPICIQPSTISSKIHEDDFYREIQTNVPILAPEILSIFANSQIFHEHQSTTTKQLNKLTTPTVHIKPNQTDTEKLLDRLTGKPENIITESPTKKLTFAADTDSICSEPILSSVVSLAGYSSETSINNNDKEHIVLRPKFDNKLLKHVQSVPDFDYYRPVSENNIYTISSQSSASHSQISMTPEIPSISFSTLPKNYLDTPTIDKYKLPPLSLQSIQTANCALISESDLTMPRYFRKSELIGQQLRGHQSADNLSITTPSTPKRIHKDFLASKRLKHFRSKLPPLVIPEKDKINKEKTKK